jgi:hypothetical protein
VAQASAGELNELWLARALDRAGIDRSRWHPSVGVEDNRRTIEAVYDYYGRLFSDHPYVLWSGMAGMIGPAFYAGLMDIGWLPDVARRAIIALPGRASRRLHTWAAGDLGFYETIFLTMQKKIFEDQAPMHEAYLAEGLTEIERFYRARIIDRATFVAWQRIDRGRGEAGATLLDSGNRALLWREQREIIDRCPRPDPRRAAGPLLPAAGAGREARARRGDSVAPDDEHSPASTGGDRPSRPSPPGARGRKGSNRSDKLTQPRVMGVRGRR